MDLELNNKHFVITGGTGGIGEAIISLLYKEGVKISVQYFKNIKKAKELKELYNDLNVNFIQVDAVGVSRFCCLFIQNEIINF